MSDRLIKIRNIPITLRKSKKARRIIISIKPHKGTIISIPYGIAYEEGVKTACENIDWIQKHLEKIRLKETAFPLYDENSGLVARNHSLELMPSKIQKIKIRITDTKIELKYPENLTIVSPIVQESIRTGIEKAYREEAKEYLPKRLNDLSDKFGIPFNELYIKNIKSRWGSCSAKNNINLSLHLMRLPDYLIDYVLLHELAHTRIKNHGKKYWEFLEKLVRGAKAIDRELRKYATSIH